MKRTSVSCRDINRLIRFAHNYMRVHNNKQTLGELLAEQEQARKCKACNQPGEWREGFSAVLCNYHTLLALLGWLNSQPKMLRR